MNEASYAALVSLGPKSSGRVFKTRYIKTAYKTPLRSPSSTTSPSTLPATRLHPGPSCGESH